MFFGGRSVAAHRDLGSLERASRSRDEGREARLEGIESERLPAYAPELNPMEAMWSHAKYAKLANFVPDDDDVLSAVNASLADHS